MIALSVLICYFDVVVGLNSNYCEPINEGVPAYKLTVAILFHVLPLIFGLSGSLVALISLKRKHRRSVHFDLEFMLALANTGAYILHIVIWTPYLTITLFNLDVSNRKCYYAAWCGILRPLLTAMFYPCMHDHIRYIYRIQFNYLFGRRSSENGYIDRRRRRRERNVEAHELARAITTPRPPPRSTSHGARDTQSL